MIISNCFKEVDAIIKAVLQRPKDGLYMPKIT